MKAPEPSDLSPLLRGLNAQQQEAVLATEGPVLILAGAGSGKTRVITHRIAHLVLERGQPSEAILAVTFTNKAAGEMRARVEALAGAGLKAWISTFHSLCVRILRREAAAAGLPHDFAIYDEDDQLQAVRQALRELDLAEKLNPPRRLLSRISARKNSGRDPEEAADGDSVAEKTLQRVWERYANLLNAAHALDFDDLLLKAVALFERDEAVREAYRRRFRYVLVDEYQDTNRAQYDLVRHLVGPSGNVTVVGDEDQSIYSWRGADIRNILDFERDFPGARVLRLEQNYRSTQNVLDAATALVAHNQQRKGKTLVAVKAGGEKVRLHQAADEYQEAAWVVARIREAGGRGVAILFRMNAQSRVFEEALLRNRMPYLVVGGVGFYERKEVKDVLAYLRLLRNPSDPVALRRVINVPPRGIGERTVQEVERAAAERGISAWEALRAVEEEALLPARATQPLRRFRELVEVLRQDVQGLPVKAALERVIAGSGYAEALAREDTQESQSRLENLAELLSAAADHDERSDAPSVTAFLDQVSLLSDQDQVKDDAPVVLLTLHAVKGLEYDTVFLVGLEEGLAPHARSIAREAGIEEERRLVYVGMTRARERLFLTHALSRQVFGQRRPSEPSRFLLEVPRHALVVTADAPRYAPAAPAWTRRPEAGRAGPPATPAAPLPPAADARALRPGAKVRHPLFGVGTVVRSEGGGDDLKVTVSFLGIGAKRLVARFAGLEIL